MADEKLLDDVKEEILASLQKLVEDGQHVTNFALAYEIRTFGDDGMDGWTLALYSPMLPYQAKGLLTEGVSDIEDMQYARDEDDDG